jgi:hypothetical protein
LLPGMVWLTLINLSVDHQNWRTVDSADKFRGQPHSAEFSSVKARYIRVGALKPDAPDQQGRQMAVAGWEIYE